MSLPAFSLNDSCQTAPRMGQTIQYAHVGEGYPDCDFVAWGKPLPEKCPECGSSYLIEKWLKAGPVAQCPNGECKYKRELPKVEQTA